MQVIICQMIADTWAKLSVLHFVKRFNCLGNITGNIFFMSETKQLFAEGTGQALCSNYCILCRRTCSFFACMVIPSRVRKLEVVRKT